MNDATPINKLDFGLTMNAQVMGDDFFGTMTAVGLSMEGAVAGDFYGPLFAAPVEIGGAFAINGVDGTAYGGLLGIAD